MRDLLARERRRIPHVGRAAVRVFLDVFGREVEGGTDLCGRDGRLFFDTVEGFVVAEGQESNLGGVETGFMPAFLG